MRTARKLVLLCLVCWSSLCACLLQAQWVTESFTLKPGWNAIYLHVDSSHETLDNLIGSGSATPAPISEVWMWVPTVGTTQFVQSPQDPITGSQWLTWKAAGGASSNLQRLTGNVACLVFSTAATDYVWMIHGQPRLPNHEWSSSGLNFVGFPTVAASPPSFESFLSQVPVLQQTAEIFEYTGGVLSSSNPSRVFALRTTPVTRGTGFWIRSGTFFNRYYGPFEVKANSPNGIDFGSVVSVARFRLRNLSTSDLTISVEHVASQTPPNGQATIAGTLPLLVRGVLNQTDLTYAYSSLLEGGTHTWTLAPNSQPGSVVEVILGLNRDAITANPGELLAGVLRFTDSLGQTSVDMPVSATVGSKAGLWVGSASISKVRSFLRTYQRDATGAAVMSNRSNDFGSYIVTDVNNNLGDVPREFPLRLILHTDGSNTRLLQRIYYGLDQGANFINATRQSFLDPAQFATARRISAVHLPFTQTNEFWSVAGGMDSGTSLMFDVNLPHDAHASNPFLHTFHPDHDNLDANFSSTQLPAGFESFNVKRAITLSINPPADNFNALTRSRQTYEGVYSESLTFEGKQTAQGVEARTYETQGSFTVNRVNSIPTLTTQ